MGRLIALAILVFALAVPAAAQATALPQTLQDPCPTYGDQQICSGDVPSFDGSKLDDDADGADKAQWNSHWFARHGYYVLTYTARGFRDDGPSADYEPPTPSED